jgi:hypothetical protein
MRVESPAFAIVLTPPPPLRFTSPPPSSKMPQSCLKVASKLPQRCLKVSSKFPQSFLKLSSNFPQTFLKLSSNFFQTFFKLQQLAEDVVGIPGPAQLRQGLQGLGPPLGDGGGHHVEREGEPRGVAERAQRASASALR